MAATARGDAQVPGMLKQAEEIYQAVERLVNIDSVSRTRLLDLVRERLEKLPLLPESHAESMRVTLLLALSSQREQVAGMSTPAAILRGADTLRFLVKKSFENI